MDAIEAATPAEEAGFTIGDLARTYNVTLRALRFYESRGLITPTRRGTARFYDRAAKARLEVILKGKQLGFTLSEIRGMLAETGGETQGVELALRADQILAQIDHLQRQRADIDVAIRELHGTHERLTRTFTPPAHAAAC